RDWSSDVCSSDLSFWVITGTTRDHNLSSDVALAAKSNATIVILMGMGKLPEIVKLFRQEGKSELPIAIIQNGTCKDEKVGLGTIGSIEEIVVREQLGNPAIIIIGEVVKHRSVVLDYTRNLESKSQFTELFVKDGTYI